MIIALIAVYAGIDLLRGGTFGLVMGYLFAGLGAIRWLFVIPAAPVLAVVVIALCVMVIYGLASTPNNSRALRAFEYRHARHRTTRMMI